MTGEWDKGLIYDPGSELRLYHSRKEREKKDEHNDRDERTKKKRKPGLFPPSLPAIIRCVPAFLLRE